MQRVLPRGEIESLDHTLIPRLRPPHAAEVFNDRAARLRSLAIDHPIGAYLRLMAHLCDAQHRVLATFEPVALSSSHRDQAQAHGMPLMPATSPQRDGRWLQVLRDLLDDVEGNADASTAALDTIAALREAAMTKPEALDGWADQLLAGRDLDPVAVPFAPFLMAALQVVWTAQAAAIAESDLAVVTPFGVCPVCGSLPVASIVRVGGREDGCRYLCCGLCSSQWHMVRVTCSHCQDTKDIAYHSIEGESEAIKAESCGACTGYRKIFYQDKDLYVDAIADDLASLALDVLMAQEGFGRNQGNPLLYQPVG